MILWLLGDIFNIIGAILQKVLPTMIILAVYYTLADIVLLIQCIVYNRRNAAPIDPKHLSPATPLLEETYESYGTDVEPQTQQESQPSRAKSFGLNLLIVLSVVLAGVLGWFLSGGDDDNDQPGEPEEPEFDVWGQVFGYLCAILYLGSRIPQILLNYRRKSVDGISFLFFLFACLGNLTYVVSILVKDHSQKYLLINASWLAGSLGTLVEDFTIFVQFWIYNDAYGLDSDSESEDEDSMTANNE